MEDENEIKKKLDCLMFFPIDSDLPLQINRARYLEFLNYHFV